MRPLASAHLLGAHHPFIDGLNEAERVRLRTGRRDLSITKRYVHPQEYNTRAAMEKARVALSGHKTGHSPILNTS